MTEKTKTEKVKKPRQRKKVAKVAHSDDSYRCDLQDCDGVATHVEEGRSLVRCPMCWNQWNLDHCWKDGTPLDSRKDVRCEACGWMHCPVCRACAQRKFVEGVGWVASCNCRGCIPPDDARDRALDTAAS